MGARSEALARQFELKGREHFGSIQKTVGHS